MRYLFILKITLEMCTYALIFWAIHLLFKSQGETSFIIAFLVTTLINLLFGRLIRDTIRPYMEAPFIYRLNRKKMIFENCLIFRNLFSR